MRIAPFQDAPARPSRPSAGPGQGPVIGRLEVLQLREADLQEALARYQAQRPVLERQAQNANPVLRSGIENQLMQTDLGIATVQAELSSVQAQIARLSGRQGPVGPGRIIVQPGGPRSFLDRIDPDALTAMMVISTLALVIPLSLGLLRRMWRRPPAPQPATPLSDALSSRFDRLEQAVDAMAIEIERVAESQRFVARVLVERTPQAAQPNSAHAKESPELDEAKPFLALGAGPIEPVRVGERDAVKVSKSP
jgi:hypothetical protein